MGLKLMNMLLSLWTLVLCCLLGVAGVEGEEVGASTETLEVDLDLLEHNMLKYPTFENMLSYRANHDHARTKRQAIKEQTPNKIC